MKGGHRFVEDDPDFRILQSLVEHRHRGAEDAPGDAVARLVEAREGRLEPVGLGETAGERDGTVLEDQLRGHGSPEREFPLVVFRAEPGRSFLHQEPGDLAVQLCPDECKVRESAVRDPGLGPVEDVPVPLFDGARDHPRRVGPVVGFGQPKAADLLSPRHRRQPSLLLLLRAEGVDGEHDQSALDRDEAPQAGVSAFEFLHDEAVGHGAESGAAVPLKAGAQRSQFGQLRDQILRKRPLAVMPFDSGHHLLRNERANGVANQALLFAQELVDVVVVEGFEGLHVSPLGAHPGVLVIVTAPAARLFPFRR